MFLNVSACNSEAKPRHTSGIRRENPVLCIRRLQCVNPGWESRDLGQILRESPTVLPDDAVR